MNNNRVTVGLGFGEICMILGIAFILSSISVTLRSIDQSLKVIASPPEQGVGVLVETEQLSEKAAP